MGQYIVSQSYYLSTFHIFHLQHISQAATKSGLYNKKNAPYMFASTLFDRVKHRFSTTQDFSLLSCNNSILTLLLDPLNDTYRTPSFRCNKILLKIKSIYSLLFSVAYTTIHLDLYPCS